jgi:hypothetical protein
MSMTRSTAVAEERGQVEAMIRLLGLQVEDGPTKLTPPAPDFRLKLRDGRTVGVEVTRALDERIASGRGAVSHIERRVENELSREGLSAWVVVGLREEAAAYLNDHPKDFNREVNAIVALVRKTVDLSSKPRGTRFERIDHEFERLMGRRRRGQEDVEDLRGSGVEVIDSVLIGPSNAPLVSVSTVGNGQRANIVQAAIDAKAADLPRYRQCGASEIWLLVVGSARTGGSLFVSDVEDLTFSSQYDQTIFLELFEGRCIDLRTTKPDAAAAF